MACLEEVAWRNGWLTDSEVEAIAKPMMKNDYGQYLQHLVDEKHKKQDQAQ